VLAGGGWEVEDPRQTGQRWEVTGRRDGFVVYVTMSQDQGVLRLSGETPAFLIRSAPPPRPSAGEPDPDEPDPDEPDLEEADPDDEPWRPAGWPEEILVVAHQQGDLTSYVTLLRRMRLYVPVAGDPAQSPGYGTLTVGDRSYLAAYTSVESLEYGLGPGTEYQEMTYQQLAAAWPDPDWQLAVNGGTPIEVYLPIEDAAAPDQQPG
jgi:hypothetical protein